MSGVIGDGPRLKREAALESYEDSPFGAVYMNNLARIALLDGKQAKFPIGATIVREKLLTETSLRPELLSVMTKREKGFNPKAGDWEFLVIDGSLGQVQRRHTQGECLACHALEKDRDFVYRVYE